MSRRKRGRLEIVAELLALAQEPRTKSDLMYEARLDFRGLKRNLEFLTGIGFLEENQRVFKTTEKGLVFLRRYDELAKLLAKECTRPS